MKEDDVDSFAQLKSEWNSICEMFGGKKELVGIQDLGFRYGYGVFETLMVRSGKAQFRDWHEENLREAARAMGMEVPDLSPLMTVPDGDGIWRWYLTPSGLRTWFTPESAAVPETYRVGISPIRISSLAWESRYKTLSYLQHYQAWLQRGANDEALLLNEHGEIASAAMANVFWFKDGVLFTPELACGCRNGVVRRWVLGNFEGRVCEVRSSLAALENADEIFLTNSRIGIMSVADFCGRKIADRPLTARLRRSFPFVG